jgi:hypothetical protein
MNTDTFLLRQVHPAFIQSGKITSQVFRPTPKDESKLSLYNGDLINPEDAYSHYTSQLFLESAGVVAITKAECESQELQIVEDCVPFPEHCSLDFGTMTKSQVEKKAKYLKKYAETRGWLFEVKR